MNRRDFMTGALAAGGLSPLLARPGHAAMQNGAATPAKTGAGSGLRHLRHRRRLALVGDRRRRAAGTAKGI